MPLPSNKSDLESTSGDVNSLYSVGRDPAFSAYSNYNLILSQIFKIFLQFAQKLFNPV